MKNKPLSDYKKKKLIESFCDELTATQASHRLNLDRNTVNKYFRRIRECIAAYREYRKMQLLVSALKSHDLNNKVVSKRFEPSATDGHGFTVQVMLIGDQLLTELDHASDVDIPAFMLNISEYVGVHNPSINHMDIPFSSNGELQLRADGFHKFTSDRFKRYFGIKPSFIYLYLKEAEFVFNEKDPKLRASLIGRMADKIFY